jgi:hypothetical protein
MAKPVIFLSHSSNDGSALGRLKAAILKKTSSTVTVYLSSDGQSIPLGRNWVHEIEQALTSSALMFVFVSSRALSSQWIFFEAGFAYSKNVQVIPIGLPDIDLAEVPPPLSLLQGFNVRSSEGLNNIIAVLNKTFSFAYPENFTDEEYQEIFGHSFSAYTSILGPYADVVDQLVFDIYLHAPFKIEMLKPILDSLNIQNQMSDSVLRSYGVAFARGRSIANEILRISIRPAVVQLWFETLEEILRGLGLRENNMFRFSVLFKPVVQRLEAEEDVSVRFFGTNVKLLAKEGYVLGDLHFLISELDPPKIGEETQDIATLLPKQRVVNLRLGFSGNTLKQVDLSVLLQVLFDTRILWSDTHSRL